MLNDLRQRWLKWTGWLVGWLVLGALGSGLWQRLGDPIYVSLRDGGLNLATLGLTTLKDSLYTSVALGLHERASTQLLGMIMGSGVIALFFALRWVWFDLS